MQDYGHVLCLFCKTGREQSVAHRISENGVGNRDFPAAHRKALQQANAKAYEEIKDAPAARLCVRVSASTRCPR